jgi:hypothetical protein
MGPRKTSWLSQVIRWICVRDDPNTVTWKVKRCYRAVRLFDRGG